MSSTLLRSAFAAIVRKTSPEVLRAGHPALRARSLPVKLEDLKSPAFLKIVRDMDAVFDSLGHPICLIAYQLIDKQLLREKRIDKPIERTFVVNPVMRIMDRTPPEKWEAEYEFCESIPYYSGLVRRANHVFLEGVDLHGKSVGVNAKGVLARVIQHEMDHLEGIMFPDKMEKHSLRHDDYVDKFEMVVRNTK